MNMKGENTMLDIINAALNFVKALLELLKEGKAADIIGLIGQYFGKADKGEEVE